MASSKVPAFSKVSHCKLLFSYYFPFLTSHSFGLHESSYALKNAAG
jgi:hypothetical protein